MQSYNYFSVLRFPQIKIRKLTLLYLAYSWTTVFDHKRYRYRRTGRQNEVLMAFSISLPIAAHAVLSHPGSGVAKSRIDPGDYVESQLEIVSVPLLFAVDRLLLFLWLLDP